MINHVCGFNWGWIEHRLELIVRLESAGVDGHIADGDILSANVLQLQYPHVLT